ncbi:serine hydrolase domain-containing protein [Shimia biformata]|uniref:serine hydrolase domain-containing protein n=1 Tax=Shimia biformata TaxID=1294299 RepID=UPI00195030D8|nr:serine hydrolase [Shimia biformata]
MKSSMLALALLSLTQPAIANDLRPVDSDFLAQVEPFGISQANWDNGEHAATTFPNAYRFTRHYEISPGSNLAPESWQDATGSIDLGSLIAHDADGAINLETLLRDRLKNHTMVILKGDRLLHQHFWNGMTASSTHLDMSVTKSFTATLAGIAASEGLLDMSQPVQTYLPAFAGTAFEGVSIQDVADMNSGLNIKTPPFKSWDPRFTQSQEWNGPNDSGLHGITDYLVTIDSRKFEPGTHFQYQDPNTEVLGLVTEAVTGVGLAEYMHDRLWSRIGAEGPAYWMADAEGNTVASGGLNMRTRDLARVGRVFLNGGRNYLGEQVVPEEFITAIFEGNDRVRAAWTPGKEAALAPDGWYKDQIRVLNIKGHKIIAFVGIHGQTLVMEPATDTVIAMNSGYPQTESERMNTLLFLEAVPTLLDAAANQ